MTKDVFLKSIFLGCVFCLLYPLGDAFGHGVGSETISSIEVNDKEISLAVELPMNFDSTGNGQIAITAIDKETKQSPRNLTLFIELYKNENLILEDNFLAQDGILVINVKNAPDIYRINGSQDSFLGAWYGTKEKPLVISGPILDSGGLYHFAIQIKTIDETNNLVENPQKIFADVSMIDTTFYEKSIQEGKTVTFQMKSYFDEISNFEYDSENKVVTFEMPFDWSEKQISHIPVVHEEVHFPKDFAEFLTPGYVGKVNGIDLFKSSITVDDYSIEDERIVHFVLLGDHLKFIKNELQKTGNPLPQNIFFSLSTSDTVDFPISAMTKNEQFQVDMSWEPLEIEPEKNTKFVFTIRDGTTGETLRQSSYDFVLIQNGKEIYRTNGEAAVGGSFEDFTFSKDQTGPTIIRLENIRGTGEETEFGIVVVPEFGAISLLILLVGLSSIFLIRKNSLIYSRY